MRLKRRLVRMYSSVAPWLSLRIVFKPVSKLSSLCHVKDRLPSVKKSNVVYKVPCDNCDEFYVGKTVRRLEQRLEEHAADACSALFKHAQSTGHTIGFNETSILCSDAHQVKLLIKETLKIRELSASKSLNGNQGSFELKLW